MATRTAVRDYVLQYVVTLHYDVPLSLGEGDYKFSGIELYVHRLQNDVMDYIGYQYFDGAVGDVIDIEVTLPLPEEDDTWRFYALSRSETVTNDLILKGGNDETPSVDVSVLADPYSGVAAPDALLFKVGTLELDGTYTATPRWDHTVKNLLFDWGAVIQEDISNWTSLVIFIKTADSTYIQATGDHLINAFTIQDDGTYAIRDTISISGTDLPVTPETWTFIACSKNDVGYLNLSVGNPIGLEVAINTLSPYALQVTGAAAAQGTGEYTEQGEETYYFYGTYTVPTDPLWESVEITALWAGDSEAIILGRYGSSGSWQTDAWPLFQSRDVDIKFYSISTGGLRNETSPPLVEFTVSPTVGSAGIEYAPVVTSPTAVRSTPTRYGDTANFNTPGGIELYGFTLGWAVPTSALYSGVKIYCEFSGGDKVLLAVEEKPSIAVVTDQWPTGPTTFTVDIWFVSFRGVLDNTFAIGVTPKIQVQITVATPGTVKGEKVVDIPAASFASGIKPVELVTTLPTLPSSNYPVGTPVYKINDDPPRLYRVDIGGNTWTSEVDGTDLIADTVTAGAIAAGAVGTQELYAGEVLVGQGGGKPTRFKVVDSGSNLIAFIGDDPTVPLVGGYFKNLWVGPSLADIRMKASAAGIELTDATFVLDYNGITTTITNASIGGSPTGLSVKDNSSSGEVRVGLTSGNPRLWLGGKTAHGTVGIYSYGSGQGGTIVMTDVSLTSGIEMFADAYGSGGWRGKATLGGVNCVRELLVASTQVIDASRNFAGVNCDMSGVYKMDGVEVINASKAFVGAGVACTTAGLGGTGHNTYQSGWFYGVTGPTTFTTVDSKTVTVRGGIITSIV